MVAYIGDKNNAMNKIWDNFIPDTVTVSGLARANTSFGVCNLPIWRAATDHLAQPKIPLRTQKSASKHETP